MSLAEEFQIICTDTSPQVWGTYNTHLKWGL